jgi:hypothetical protein
MIEKLSIRNFKSIKELAETDCRRVNLFIGEPNTGKSNILEALGLLSWCGHGSTSFKEYVRFQGTQNLFYDNLTDESVEITTIKRVLGKEDIVIRMRIEFEEDGNFHFSTGYGGVVLDYSAESRQAIDNFPIPELRFLKYYTFERQDVFQGTELSFLMPPHGSNMFAVVSGKKKPRKAMAGFFRDLGFKLMLRIQTKSFEFLKEVDDVIFSYPYILASDTLQRMIFYNIAIESNENSTLVFEEPEAHAFPSQTYQLGEKIASDGKNQYFIATHNPYLFLSILERAPKDEVNVFITYFEDYQTKVKCLSDEEKSRIMVYDPFANLDYFIGSLDSFVEEE